MQRSYPFRITLLLIISSFVCLLSTMSSAETRKAQTTLQLKQECIDEPVFSGRGCLYLNRHDTSRPTLVFVHGINGSAVDWLAQINEFKNDYNLLLLDLPGFGASSTENRDYSPDNYARYLEFIRQRYLPQPFILIGHSLGGAIALQYTALHPEQIERLVVSDVAGVLHKIAFSKSFAGSWATKLFGDRVGRFIHGITGEWMNRVEGWRIPGDIKNRDNLTPAMIAGYSLIQSNFSVYTPLIKTPTLILWQEGDRIAPLRTGHALTAQLENSYLKTFPGTGHMPMRTHSKLFNQRLMQFLQAADSKLATYIKERRPTLNTYRGRWDAACRNRRNMEFEGDFIKLELYQCANIRIINSTITELDIYESRFEIINSQIGSMKINGSDAVITATTFDGRQPLTISRSRVDLAGVKIRAEKSSIKTLSPSEVVFSISELESPLFSGPMQGLVQMKANKEL